ncbi:MAG TPA: hypothetical protein VFS08_19290 [Gemmatimonadaceae bacterium]|nr:hypothetical protein [Gemmatimonadaceae bacterium]
MTTSSLPARASSPGRSLATPGLVVAGGLIAGTLDIAYACAFWAVRADVPARRIFQSVAAGLLGPASFDGGTRTAALGLALHYLIALSMSVAYYRLARRWAPLWRRPVVYGGGYGLLLYGIMNYVVVPLSAAGPSSRDPLWVAVSVGVHVLLIGLPIALATRAAVRAGRAGAGGRA